MAKQLNQATVHLAFTADANQAKREIQGLQQSLNKLATVGAGPKSSTGLSSLTVEAQKAMVAAAELQASLESAINVNTGKLDLTKFNSSLKRSNKTLNDYAVQLSGLGPQGQQAFMQLTQAIIKSEAPLVRLNGKMKEFATSIANTARWQLSSSIIHGLMGGLQQAFGYAQDLNHSLNDIRIVTGQSVDQMKAFAAEANRSAKALSATTNEYAKASLIYYQQGLNDKQVKERTDVTIKMANAAGVDAQTASDQLTAIWNNFAKNGKNLEYYADVITALGAATASSSDEISQGLEKFAAVSESVGLSYEYATSALATVTATTRQSADVVGNAFKTLFARIQGLNLGETLDDGTTLNKYSQALAKVGISIKDQSGQLKEMDTILDEMGAKWGTLNKDQQVALAQTVAGVRQYTQLIALMENWDTFEVNLKIAEDSSGTLQKQQDIYAESWEAARDRVRTAAEDIYDSLLNDEAFINILNGIEKVITAIGGMVDGLGGLRGLLTSIGAVAFNIFNKEISNGIRNTVNGMKMLTPKGKAEVQNQKVEALNAAEKMIQSNKGSSLEAQAQNAAMQRELTIQKTLLANEKNLTDEQKKAFQIRLDSLRALEDQNKALAKQVDLLETAAARSSLKLENQRAKDLQAEIDADPMSYIKSDTIKSKDLMAAYGGKENLVKEYNNFLKETNQTPDKGQIYSIQKMLNDKNFLQKAIGDGKFNSFIPTGRDLARQETIERQETAGKIGRLKSFQSINKDVITGLERKDGSAQISKDYFNQIKTTYESAAGDLDGLADPATISNINEIIESLKKLDAAAEEGTLSVEELAKALKATDADNLESAIQGVEEEFLSNYTGDNYDQAVKEIDAAAQRQNLQNSNVNLDQHQDDFINDIQSQGVQNLQAWENKVTAVSGAIMALGATISAVQGVIDVFNDPDATAWDKITAILGALIGVVPALMSGFTGLATTFTATGAAAGAASVGINAMLWPILAVIAAIGVLTAAFVLFSEAAHKASPAGQFETAAQAAENAAQAAEDCRIEYENLINALDGLDSGIDKISQMQKGTLEWRQAIIESNDALIDLLSSYGKLSSDNFTVDENGLMHLKEGVREEMIQEQMDRLESANNSKYLAEMGKNTAEQNLKAANQDTGIEVMRSYGDHYEDAVRTGNQLNADINNAIAEALADGFLSVEDLMTETAEDGVDPLVSVLKEVTGLYDQEAEMVASQIRENNDLIVSFQELAASSTAAKEANAVLAQEIGKSLYGDTVDKSGLNEQTQQEVLERLGTEIAARAEDLYEKEYKDKFLGKWDDKSIQQEYAKLMGYTWVKNSGNNKGVYSKGDGSADFTIDDDIARRALAEAKAKEEMSDSKVVQEYIQAFDSIAKSTSEMFADMQLGKDSITNLTDAITSVANGSTGDFSNLTTAELELIKQEVENLKANMTDETAVALGYQDAADYGKYLDNTIEQTSAAFESAGKSLLSSYAKDQIFDKYKVNLTLADQGILETQLNELFNNSGYEGVRAFENALAQIDPREQSEFLQLLNTIDWSKGPVAMTEFKEACAKAGIEIEANDEIWLEFAKHMENTNAENLLKDLSDIRSLIAEINGLTKDLSTGDIISDEQYQRLVEFKAAMGEDITNSFVMTPEGYKYTGTEDLSGMGMDYAKYEIAQQNDQLGLLTEGYKASERWRYDGGKGENVDWSDYGSSSLYSYTDRANTLDSIVHDDTGSAIIEAANLLSQSQGGTGFNTDNLSRAVSIVANEESTPEQREAALALMNSFYDTLAQLEAEGAAGQYEGINEDELLSGMATNTRELEGLYDFSEGGADEGERYTGSHAKGLQSLAAEYESCREELEAYNEALRSGDTEKAIEAAKDLEKAIKSAEWDKLTDEAIEYYDVLEDGSSTQEEQDAAFDKLAKSFKKAYDVKPSKEFFKKNKDFIKDWSKATGKEFEQLNTKMQSLLNAEKFEQLDLENIVPDTDTLKDTFGTIENAWSKAKSIIESTPITLTAEGEADMSALVGELMAAGFTAEQVAAILEGLGASDVNLDGFAENIEGLEAALEKIRNAVGPEEKAAAYVDFVKVVNDSGVGVDLDSATYPVVDEAPEMETVKGSGGKGGGGGSGGDLLEPKHNKDEIERYHEIKNTLEDLEREYERLKTARERAYGMTKVGLINQEIEKTKELAEAQKQYMTEINDNLVDDRKALEAFGATFDERGNINNYDSLVAGWVKEFNAVRTEEADEAYQEKMDALKQYEETHDLWEDEYDQLIEYYNQIVDLSLEAVVVEVEFKIELSEKEVERIEYQLDKLSRSRTLNLDIQINKIGDYIPEYIEQSKVIREGIEKIYAESRKYGLTELTQDQWDQVNEWQSQLLELNTTVLDLITEVEDKLSEAIGSLGERFDEAEGRFDSYLGVLEHFNDVMELTGLHTKEFATYEALLQQRLDTTSAKINNNKKELDTYNAALVEAQAMLARAVTQGDQENVLFWEEKVRELEIMTEEAYEAFISSWKDTVEAATEFFESKVEAIIQSFKDNIFSEGLDNMADKLDKVNDVRERYLDDLTRWYELSKLNRELEKSIDDTDNISAKRRLAEFQKEVLEYQKEGVEMSEYELNHTRARYELLLAEIALEEARNAKNQVQLKRDSEGNWGYVYTADKDAIAEAEQNYEDKLFEMKEAAIEYKEEMESLVIEAMTDMFEELADLDSTAADYQEKAWNIYQFYYEKLGYLATEFDMALANSNQTLADTVFADEGIMTDFLTYINGIMEEAKEAPAELIKQYEWLQDTIRDANEQAGIDTDNFSGDVIVNIDWVGDKTHDLAQDMDTYTEEIRQSIIKVMQTTQSWKETYLSAIKEMMAANETWNLASYEIPDGYSSWEDYYKDHPSEIDWDWQPTYTGKKEGEYRGYMWADVIPVLSSGGGSGGG